MGDHPSEPQHRIRQVVEDLYAAFECYELPDQVDFCGFCYEPAEREYLRVTHLRCLEPDRVRQLVWETGDHWANTDLYKHYLPRILEVLAGGVEDMYPEHLFEVLNHHRFRDWPPTEKQLVLRFVAAMEESMPSDESRDEWRRASTTLVLGTERR